MFVSGFDLHPYFDELGLKTKGMEAEQHTLLHRKTISRRKQIYCQIYNLYAYTLH